MGYEELLLEADGEGLIVKEMPLQLEDGLIMGKKIAIRNNIRTTNKKADVLAEELGHHYTTSGNIMEYRTLRMKNRNVLHGYGHTTKESA